MRSYDFRKSCFDKIYKRLLELENRYHVSLGFNYVEDELSQHIRIKKSVRTRPFCSRYCCGNRRKYIGITLKEVKMYISEREQINDYYDRRRNQNC